MTRRDILVTGFGPFPGVPRNASAELALRLGGIVLATEWAAPLPDFAGFQAVILFGVSRRAPGLVLERHAYNGTRGKPDAANARPAALREVAARPRIATPFPAAQLAARLRRAGHPATTSTDPGRYLCNAVYYRALDAGAPALFVHIPPRRSMVRLEAAARHLLALIGSAA